MPSYEKLLEELNVKATLLRTSLNANWGQYLSSYINVMQDIDSWLRYLDDEWLKVSNSDAAQQRLNETESMRRKGKEFATNKLPWLRNAALLEKNDTRELAVNKSAALIIEHASRRVDFYFMSLLFFYNKPVTIEISNTDRTRQHVHGIRADKTESSHSAIISNFIAQTKTGEILPASPHVLNTLATTVELPTVVNDFDGVLEGKIQAHLQSKWRKSAIAILNKVSGRSHEPRKALIKFLIVMLDFFSNDRIKNFYWSSSSSIDKRLTYVFQCIGTFYFLWGSRYSLDNYIHLFMRLNSCEIRQFQEKNIIGLKDIK